MSQETTSHDFPFLPSRVRDVMAVALRLAAGANGAPQRCRRKTCRRSGRCHITIGSNGEGDCPGGINEVALDQAALLIHFLQRLGEGSLDI